MGVSDVLESCNMSRLTTQLERQPLGHLGQRWPQRGTDWEGGQSLWLEHFLFPTVPTSLGTCVLLGKPHSPKQHCLAALETVWENTELPFWGLPIQAWRVYLSTQEASSLPGTWLAVLGYFPTSAESTDVRKEGAPGNCEVQGLSLQLHHFCLCLSLSLCLYFSPSATCEQSSHTLRDGLPAEAEAGMVRPPSDLCKVPCLWATLVPSVRFPCQDLLRIAWERLCEKALL